MLNVMDFPLSDHLQEENLCMVTCIGWLQGLQ